MAEAPATAAPTAPNAGAPAAHPATGTTVPDSGIVVPDSGTPDTQQRLAKPIKPIPRLPGVFPDDDPFPYPPSSDADPPAASALPPRGPDGRFVAPSSSATPAGEHTPEPAKEPAPTRFKFAGEEFESQAAAEQNFKSLRGQFKPLQSLARSVGGVEQVVPKFAEAAASARGWKAEAERISAELAARNGQPAAAQSAAPPAQPAEASEPAADVDWELYAEVKKLATERGEPWKAEQWLIEQVRASERSQMQQMLDQRFAPFEAQQQHAAVAAQTEQVFAALADYTNADGSLAFPELHDEAAAYEVGRLWADMGLPREHALSHRGAIAAIALYRMTKQPRSQARTAAPTPPQAPSPPPADTQSAASLTDGRPTVASVSGNGSQSAEAQRILAALRSTHSPNRAVLGFDA
jgi:hypothetical protein